MTSSSNLPGSFAPLLIGPANCESTIGVNWRWLRDHAPALGLQIIMIERKCFIDARAAHEAILAHQKPTEAPIDELDAMRAKLGKRRVG